MLFHTADAFFDKRLIETLFDSRPLLIFILGNTFRIFVSDTEYGIKVSSLV